MISLHPPEAIAQAFFGAADPAALTPHHHWPAVEISGDCVFLNAQQALSETQGRDAPLARLGQDWWVFACSGTGDAWLMSLDGQQRIAFLDHDQGPDAVAQPMGLNFAQWLQTADLLHQWELVDDEALAPALQGLLEQISTGLCQRFPYAF